MGRPDNRPRVYPLILSRVRLVFQVEVVAVSSRSMARAKAWADERKIPKAYGSHAELLADPDVDAVYIPMPTGVRCDMVRAPHTQPPRARAPS